MSFKEAVELPQLVASDYDGTIAVENGLVPEISYLGMEALQQCGVSATMVTARPYQRLATVIEGQRNITRLVSLDMPLVSERGGRFVDPRKLTNIHYMPFTSYELDAIGDIGYSDTIDFVGFYPKEVLGQSYIWTPAASRQQEMYRRFGHDAHILDASKSDLQRALHDAEPCVVTVKFTEDCAENTQLLDSGLTIAWERKTAAITAEGVNKKASLLTLCDLANIELADVAYAGNDTSDVPILQMPQLRQRIFVGNNTVDQLAEPVVRLRTPQELGEFLLNVARG